MIERRNLPSGHVSWRVRWRDAEGRERSKSFPTRTEARRFDADRLRGARRVGHRMTVKECWCAFEASRSGVAPATRAFYAGLWGRYVEAPLGARQVAAVTPYEVQAVVNAVAERLSATTAGHVRRLVRAVLEEAVRAEVVAVNPARYARAPRTVPRLGPVPSPEQARGLWEAMPTDRSALATQILASTGLRWGEASALRWEDVEGHQVHVRRAYSAVGGRLVLGPTKGRTTRQVPIPGLLGQRLMRYRATATHELVICTLSGNPISNSNFRREAKWAATTATVGLTGLRIHDLRHGYATNLLAQGAPVATVSALLGHATPAVTMSVYAHATQQSHDAVRNQISELYGAHVATTVATNE